MEIGLTVAQAIGFGITIITIVIGAWINMRVNVTRIQIKILELEKRMTEQEQLNKEVFSEFKAQLKEMNDILVEIRIYIGRNANNNRNRRTNNS